MLHLDQDQDQVLFSHWQLYHYSSDLFKAIEFYGEEMAGSMKVYHGLNKQMNFCEITAYLNQSISTMPELSEAQQFTGGRGIVLILKSRPDCELIPKYFGGDWIGIE